jgi:DNA-binding MarR family transcriptional regulator
MDEMTGYARPESGARCHCTALRKALRRISQLYDTALAPSGLKTTQRAILAEIERSEPTTVGSLADALVMDAGGLAHTLKPLTREKLVTIAVDPQDRRNRLISLTRLGRSKLRKSDALWEAAQRSFEAALGATGSADLREAMQLLVASDFTETFEAALASTGR